MQTIAGSHQKFYLKNKSTIARLSLKYPPATRALLGALLEQIETSAVLNSLIKSLSPITKYKLSGAEKVLQSLQKWNIV